MREPKKAETRKDEVRFRTSDPGLMFGKYIAENVYKKYTEDFLDENSGEVVSIERQELLFEKGRKIDEDLLSRIMFSQQAYGISEIEVSNQRRLAVRLVKGKLWPFKVKANIGGKNYTFILQAQSIEQANEIAIDYIELNYTLGFSIESVQALKQFIILNERFKKLYGDDIMKAVDRSIDEALSGKVAAENKDETERDDTRYYSVTANVMVLDEDDTEISTMPYEFLVKTKDVDTAKTVITAWVNNKFKEKAEDGSVRKARLSIFAATPYPVSLVIEKEFCMAYADEEATN